MTVGTGFEVDSSRVDAIIMRLGTRLGTAYLSGSLLAVHQYVLNKHEAMFAGEKDPYGSKWAPLAPSTVAFRQYMGYGGAHPINVRTGELRESIVGQPPDILGHSDGMVEMAFPSRRMPHTKLYLKYKQASGGGRGPARRVIGLDDGDIAWILASLNKSIFGNLGGGM
ncbi:hypothetical protein SEA_CAMERICO_18 [Gordonia phage Camerico]|nr:hypothetical protein SEA_CAMERICO_18 [Gordonia phage Camerico]